MFYYLSKIFDILLAPLTWAVLLIFAGAIARRARWKQRVLPLLGLVVLLGFSEERVANGLLRKLESAAPRTLRPDATYDVAILLGGIGEERTETTWGQRAFNDNNERLLETFDLLRTGRVRYAIVSGGDPATVDPRYVEARVLADQLVAWGIAADRVIVEPEARNTHENAVLSAAIVRARGFKSVVVVTSAYHMQRALGCFVAEGLAVDAQPVDFRSFAPGMHAEWMPRVEHLAASSAAMRELFGHMVYRVRGYAK